MSILLRDANTGRYKKTRLRSWTPDNWDDGFIDKKGYFHVYLPEHPLSTPAGWIRRHHALWWLINHSIIPKGKALHHKDGNKLNDSIDNLQLVDFGYHTVIHCSKPFVACICRYCKKAFYIPQWRINQGEGKYCNQSCYRASGGRWQ